MSAGVQTPMQLQQMLAWHSTRGYVFPPLSLLGKCLQKIHREEAIVVMVAPVWSTQPWYPMLLDGHTNIANHALGYAEQPFQRKAPTDGAQVAIIWPFGSCQEATQSYGSFR